MFKKLKKSVFILLFFFVIISSFYISKIKIKKYKINKNVDENIIEKSVNVNTSHSIKKNNIKAEDEYKYILKDFNGKLAVFEKNKEDPEMIFDVLIERLPEIDILELKKGLKIKDDDELKARIEDFIS